jgi:hypothetical protein
LLILFILPALADPPPAETVAEICADRVPCQLVSQWFAGSDPLGFDLQVIEVGLTDAEDPETQRMTYAGECTGFEHHLLRYRGEVVADHRLLMSTCNDGYGASGVGEDSIEIGDNRFAHQQHGGSSWRWSEGTVTQLSPERLLEESTGSYRSPVGPEASSQWSWLTLSGTQSWSASRCGEEHVDEDGDIEAEEGHSVLLPIAQPWPDWPIKGIGPCAAAVDSANGNGLVIYGEQGNAADASLKAMMTPDGELRVEVQDDVFVPTKRKWVLADHLEIWLTDGPDNSGSDCLEPWAARQWAVDLGGQVHPAHGNPTTALPATVTVTGNTARFTVQLPDVRDQITVVYSDSDDGKHQERLIANSTFRFGDSHTLGTTKNIVDSSVCTPEGQVRDGWDPRFDVVFGVGLSEELLQARLAFDRATTATELHLAWQQSMALMERANQHGQAAFDAQPEPTAAFLEWSVKHLPGWRPDVYAEGSTLLWELSAEAWAASAAKTPEPQDDAFVAVLSLAWGNLSQTGSPTWRTQTWDGGGCSDLGDGEFLAVLLETDRAMALGTTFRKPLMAVRKAALIAITGETQQYPFCHGDSQVARTKSELEAEVHKVLGNVKLSDAERAQLTQRLELGFQAGPWPPER